jgi:hypothetical protein
MTEYVASMLEVFPEKLKSTDTAITPASNGLFNEGVKERNSMNIIQWLQYHYFDVSVQDQIYSLRRSRAEMKLTRQS